MPMTNFNNLTSNQKFELMVKTVETTNITTIVRVLSGLGRLTKDVCIIYELYCEAEEAEAELIKYNRSHGYDCYADVCDTEGVALVQAMEDAQARARHGVADIKPYLIALEEEYMRAYISDTLKER